MSLKMKSQISVLEVYKEAKKKVAILEVAGKLRIEPIIFISLFQVVVKAIIRRRKELLSSCQRKRALSIF